MSDIIIEPLNSKQHDRQLFDCGIEVLNVYLKQKANQEQKKRLNLTYVATKTSDTLPKAILGYYTLSNSSLALYTVQTEFKKHIPPSYDIPSVKIGRLAVDKNQQSLGIGKQLLGHAFRRIIDVSAISGVRGIEVVAKNPQAKKFYEKFGFISLKDAPNFLFMPIETILNFQ